MAASITSAKESLFVYGSKVSERYILTMAVAKPYIINKARQLAEDLEILGVLGIGDYWHSEPANLKKYNEILKEINTKKKFDKEELASYYDRLDKVFPTANDCDMYLVLKKCDDDIRTAFADKLNHYVHGLGDGFGVKLGNDFVDIRAEDMISLRSLRRAKIEDDKNSTGPGDRYRREVIEGRAIGLYIANNEIKAQPFDPEPWIKFLKFVPPAPNVKRALDEYEIIIKYY